MECLEEELQLKVLGLHHQLSPWLLAKVLPGQVQLHLYLLNLMAEDTMGYNNVRKQRHESVLNYMQMKLFSAEK